MSSHLRILVLFLVVLGLTAAAQAQSTPAATQISLAGSQSLLGPAPLCTDPPVACPAPGVAHEQLPAPDQFGTPPGSCMACVDCQLDPANCTTTQCVNSNWSSLPGGSGVQVRPLRVRKFAPPPGVCAELLQADITVRGTACGLLRIELRDPLNSCLANMQLTTALQLEPNPLLPASPTARTIIDELFNFPVQLEAFDGTVDFAGPSGTFRVISPVTRERCFRVVDPALLALLVDTTPLDPSDDFYELDHSANATSSRQPCTPVTFLSDPYMGVELEVRYRYCEDQPPVVVDDNAGVCANGSVDIPVAANDSDPEGLLDCTSIAIGTPPAHGTATVMGCTGTGASCPGCLVRYTPNAGYVGPDSFTYTIADNLGCTRPGNVSVLVCSTTAADDSGLLVCRGGQISVPVTANDTTTCGTINCATLAVVTPPAHGTAVVNGCNIVYTATDPSFTGQDTFTYSVSNSGSPACTDTGTVTVEVCAVVAGDDSNITVCRGGQVSIPITANDTTSCGTLSCGTIVINPQPGAGTVQVQGCNVLYTAPAAFTGNVTFGYTISNSAGCSDSATVSLTVCGVNANDDTSIQLCQLSSIDVPVLNNDTSTCGTLSCAGLTIVTPPAHGTAVVVPGNPCVIRYTHTDGAHSGPDSFVYRATDSVGCNDTGTVSLNVCRTTAGDDTARTCAGQSVSIPVRANDSTDCGGLTNASITIVTPPSNGTATRSGPNIVYQPNPGFVGSDSFVYSIASNQPPFCSDTATVTIQVCATTANDDSGFRLCTGSQLSIPVTVNDSTTCGQLDCSTITIVTPPSLGTVTLNGCNVVYTAGPNAGADSFVYRIANTDGCTDTGTVSLTVCSTTANDDSGLLVCAGSSLNIAVTANDSTTCGQLDCGTLTIVTPPAHGTATVNGCNVSFTATDLAFAGVDSFVYRIANGDGCTDTATVSVQVCSVTANDDTGLRVCRGDALTINVRANDTTTCGRLDCATIQITTPPAVGTATVQGCNVVYTASDPTFLGSVTFGYTISNQAGCSDSATVQLNVCAVDARDDNNIRLCQLSSLTIPVTNNDSSSCGTLSCGTLMVVTPPLHGTAVVQGCSIVYTHTDANHSGPESFTYKIADSVGCMDTATVNLEVCLTVAQDDSAEVCSGQSVTIPVRANDATTCGALNCESITITQQPAHGTVTRRGCNVVYTSTDTAFSGQDCFSYSIASNQAPFCTDTAQVCVNVCRTNAVDDTGLRVCAGASLTIPVTANDTASCGTIDCSTLAIVNPPANGTVTVNGCNIVYTAPAGFAGQVEFTYRVSNSGTPLCTDTARVALEVCRTDAVDDTGLRVCRGSALTINVTANDTTTCGTINCATLMIVTPPSHGTATVNGCNVVYTSTDLAFAGTDSFTYKVANSTTPACEDTGRVEVAVCATVALDDSAVVCTGDSVCTPVTQNDSSTCGRLVCSSLTILTPPANGAAQVQGCTICYTPNPGFVGMDSLVYRVANAEGCTGSATLRIEVKPEPIARDDEATLPEPPAPIVVPVLDNDSPGAGCVLLPGTVTIVSQGSYGTASANADGTVTYVPDASFPDNGEDTFCYEVQNDCGCRDTACVVVRRMSCPMVNRRMPGSLLVFPEFDNRQANQTVISITNTNCDQMSAPVRVEIVYVRENDCLEANYTITLTPCDTWTALTSAHNPNFSRGYVYAFAKDAQGRAISFNWLIGQEMITDGIDQLEHGINAVVFKAIPPALQPTDLDHDGIRDLDDVEYQMAPDELLVPRFLGQDDDFGSKLVLLNLSGGKQFTAVVDFLIFNDNEELFSGQETFRCWRKWTLVEISNAFRNDFLKSTNHARDEIVGDETRESGWFRINGQSASSVAETIIDPALLGYMIERSGDWTAADLPWELCAQDNGDLLPLGIFGDGPNPVAGDNQ